MSGRPTKKQKRGETRHLVNPGIKTQSQVDEFLANVKAVVINNMVGCATLNIATQDPQIKLGEQPLEPFLRLAARSMGASYTRWGFGSPMTMRYKDSAMAVLLNRGRINLPGCRSEAEAIFLVHIFAARVSEATGVAFDVTNTWITNRHGVCYTGAQIDLKLLKRHIGGRMTDAIGHLMYPAQVRDSVLTMLFYASGTIVGCGTADLDVIRQGMQEVLPTVAHCAGKAAEPQNPTVFRRLMAKMDS